MFGSKNCYFLVINATLLLILAVNLASNDESDNNIPKEINITKWACDIGEELWKIGKRVTKLEAIKQRYKIMNATVQPTDGNQTLNMIVARMNKLIKEKVDAVMRIQNASVKAESEYIKPDIPKKNISYYSSKISPVEVKNANNTEVKNDYPKPEDLAFEQMTLTRDQHFNNVLVNVNHSSVHVPTNIYDRWDKVIEPIYWSQQLDATFRENYEKDPSLMWQYFASTSGFLRHYPAYHWSMYPDKYDCRKRIWYVQAATCSKEVIIMIDNSGTMYGMRNTIAQLTVDSLLQTFSNNDYVNVFQLKDEKANYLVDCFNDTLVQATPENVELFKNSLYNLCPGSKINFTTGFLQAFKMLHNFIQNKTEQSERRNQAIFLLTDMLPGQSELDTIRRRYNEIYNGTNIQVDLFIYFIGKDVPEIRTVQWENKCLRNGSIVHVRTMDEVPEDVLKYLPVIARTQNENTLYYPVSWTHVFLDTMKHKGTIIGEEAVKNEDDHPEYGNLNEPFIMTSVTTPVYRKQNRNLPPGKQEMIGVAAIDVPVSDFERLVISHKIGVNGYAFIVTNNGYLLFHPDLTPVKDGAFRINFNSVDLTEIEFYDDEEKFPRKPNENIVELRRRMVNQEHGAMENMTIKFHYDNQTRVGSELRNYYYAPLKCSPFTLGLALPKGYGNYWIHTIDEMAIEKLKQQNYSQYFKGDWNIHPKWTYCDFRDRKKYDYETPRKKLEKFLSMIFIENETNFTWFEEHPNPSEDDKLDFNDSFTDECFTDDTTKKPPGGYFCDRELMEVLFFDAKLTHEEFYEEISKEDREFHSSNGIQVKFVSTQSGLTRWKNLNDNDNITNRNFGETNNKALDEVWYKSAVLFHKEKAQYFVFSLPKNPGNSENSYITASHAIFYNDSKGNEAPGVVVGYEMAYSNFKKLIESNSECTKSHQHDCYIIDGNGYIVYADKDENLGRFFGEIEGPVMEQLINESVFRELSMYDYQAFVDESKPPTPSSGSFLFNPINHLIWMTQWMFSQMLWILLEMNLWAPIEAWKYCGDIESPRNNDKSIPSDSGASCFKAEKKYSDRCNTREVPPHIYRSDEYVTKMKKKAVDKQFSLYLSNPHGTIINTNRENKSCARPFEAHKIPQTNLILISIDAGHQTCFKIKSVKQDVIKYTPDVKLITDRKKLPEGKYIDTPACNKKTINAYPRKKLRGCSDKLVLNSIDNESCGSNRFFSIEQCSIVTLICHFVLFFHYLRFCYV